MKNIMIGKSVFNMLSFKKGRTNANIYIYIYIYILKRQEKDKA